MVVVLLVVFGWFGGQDSVTSTIEKLQLPSVINASVLIVLHLAASPAPASRRTLCF